MHGNALEPEALRNAGSHDDCVIVHANGCLNGMIACKNRRFGGRLVRVPQRQREETVWTRRFKRAWLLRRDGELYPKLPRGLHERGGAVRCGRQQQQQARSYFLEAWK